MNIYIETISKLPNPPERLKQFNYVVPGDCGTTILSGGHTNEAPSEYFIKKLALKNQCFDKFIMLATEECFSYEWHCNAPESKDTVVLETIKYHQKCLADYLRDTVAVDDPGKYVEENTVVIRIGNTTVKSDFSKIFKSIGLVSGEKNDIYMDFTGGSRVTAMTLLILTRIIETSGAEVRQVVYGNINSTAPVIDDATKSYRLFRTIEQIAAAQNDKAKLKKIFNALAQSGICKLEADEIKAVEAIDDEQNKQNATIRAKSEKEIRKTDEALNKSTDKIRSSAFAQTFVKAEKEKTVNKIKESPFKKLLGKNDRDLILKFHEELTEVFIDKGIIVSANGKNDIVMLKSSLKAGMYYYHHSIKKEDAGVLTEVEKWIKELSEDPGLDPQQLYAEKTDITNRYYEINTPGNVNPVKDYTTKSFIRKLKDEGITFGSGDVFEDMRRFSQLQNVYYSYGFPFMCCDQKGFCYYQVMNHYLNCAKRLTESLSRLKAFNPEFYRERLEELKSPEELEREIPYSAVGVKITKIKNPDSFMKEYLERLEKVRPTRNILSHNGIPENMKNLAKEIREWIHEYEQMPELND